MVKYVLAAALVLCLLLCGCEMDAPEMTMEQTTVTTAESSSAATTTVDPTTQAPTVPTATVAPTTEEPTVPATTVAPTTMPPTVPVTSVTPTTEAPTVPPTTAAPETEPSEGKERTYVLNTNSKKFHYPDCSSARQIKEENKEIFTGNREELLQRGYDPCKRCNP